MNGLKIKSKKTAETSSSGMPGYIHHSLEDNNSDFCCYFKSFIERLEEYSWIISESSTYISWYISEQYYIDEPELNQFRDFHDEYEKYASYRMYDNSIFKKYIGYVIDDWNEIICIKKGKSTLKEIVEKLAFSNEEEKRKYLKEYIDLIFLNIDGLFWLVFSNDNFKLNIIMNELKKYDSYINVDTCNVRDFINFIVLFAEQEK